MSKPKKKSPRKAAKKKAATAAVDRYRTRMRKKGMRLVQIWVPDVNAPGFREECARQVALVNSMVEHEREVMEWVENVQAADEWPPY